MTQQHMETRTYPLVYRINERIDHELHVFCDALKYAYGAVAYITVQPGNTISFVMAKSCVILSSAALWSIPWKEMIAAMQTIGSCMCCMCHLEIIASLPV